MDLEIPDLLAYREIPCRLRTSVHPYEIEREPGATCFQHAIRIGASYLRRLRLDSVIASTVVVCLDIGLEWGVAAHV